MNEDLCAEQMQLAPLIRAAAQRGNKALVAHYMACWSILDRMIKDQS